MKAKLFLLTIICSIGLISCSDHALMDQNVPIANKRWFNNQIEEFKVDIKDNAISYNLYLNLRNTIEYPFSNIYVLVHQQHPDGVKKTYRVKVILSDREGLWLGSSAGNLFTHQVRFLKNYRFPSKGSYTFQLEQNMRSNPIQGISDVGLRIEPSEKEN